MKIYSSSLTPRVFDRRSNSQAKVWIFFLLELLAVFLIVVVITSGDVTVALSFLLGAFIMINPIMRLREKLDRIESKATRRK